MPSLPAQRKFLRMRAEAFHSAMRAPTLDFPALDASLCLHLTLPRRETSITGEGFCRPPRRTSKLRLLRVAVPYLNTRRERGRFNSSSEFPASAAARFPRSHRREVGAFESSVRRSVSARSLKFSSENQATDRQARHRVSKAPFVWPRWGPLSSGPAPAPAVHPTESARLRLLTPIYAPVTLVQPHALALPSQRNQFFI
ncbi:hypothetical protein C8Q70DRAFT_934572 [Cubamyces menziesii]|nr:hypothetical protein C8Q70DRAFT_934572 [Cubamyces menziesii]